MTLLNIQARSSLNKNMRIAFRHLKSSSISSHHVKIIFHGLGGHSDSVTIKPIIQLALESNYDVISVDWPFHGCSSLNFGEKPYLQDMVITIEKILEYASAKYNKIDLIGHSMGAIYLIYWGSISSDQHHLVNSVVAMSPGFPKVAFYQEWIVRLIALTPLKYAHSMMSHSLEFTDNVEVVEKRFQDQLELKYIQDSMLIPIFDASKYIINNISKQKLKIKLIWSNKDPIINVESIYQLLSSDAYADHYSTQAPYHELCTTHLVGKEVCAAAIGEKNQPVESPPLNNNKVLHGDDIFEYDDIYQNVGLSQAILATFLGIFSFFIPKIWSYITKGCAKIYS